MSRVLLTGAATAAAFSAKSKAANLDLILGDYEPLPSIANFLILPSPSSASYVHQLLNLCLSKGISMIYPIRRAELEALSNYVSLFAEYGILLAIPVLSKTNVHQVFHAPSMTDLFFRNDGIYWLDKHQVEHLLICD
ncbi:MAG: hypothetical protein RLZ47_1716 [Bacteroidota bacterium]|jgi:hypothetical protein